jgi:hypothetical protein
MVKVAGSGDYVDGVVCRKSSDEGSMVGVNLLVFVETNNNKILNEAFIFFLLRDNCHFL